MAIYKYIIYSRDIPPYTRNFDFATSGDMLSHVEAMTLSGDAYIKIENNDDQTYNRAPASAINKIKVTFPE